MPVYTRSDPVLAWRTYIDSLAWVKGSLDNVCNRALLRAASLGLDQQFALDEVTRRIIDAGERPRPAKLAHQLASAYARAAGQAPAGSLYCNYVSLPKWPAPDFAAIGQALELEPGFGLVDLWEYSPCRFNDDLAHVDDVIDVLFPNNPPIDPFLCVGRGQNHFKTQRREAWRGKLDRLEFIVPNPMLSEWGRTQDGKLSQHTLEATGRRAYQVVESDLSTDNPAIALLCRQLDCDVLDLSAALHWYLATVMPLVCIVFSGGKSLHGWYRVFERSESEQRTFMNEAVRLGADLHTWNRSQFVRLPGGLRYDNGARQSVVYLNPKNAVRL